MTEDITKPKDSFKDDEICAEIIAYGKDILDSEVFRKSAEETHHMKGTVMDHTINVCVVSLKLSRQLTSRGVRISKKDLVHAALCHDLGMVSRGTKYAGRIASWRGHPVESARIARQIVPDLSERAERMILSHMWPLAGPLPDSREAMLLCTADKYASMADWTSWLTRHKYAARIKEQLKLV